MLNIETTKQQLIEERDRLQRELMDLSETDKEGNTGVHPNELDTVEFADEQPDRMEELVENEANEENIKALLQQTELALEAITGGTYGTCTACQNPIDEARLLANPAATTCIAHAN